MRFQNVRRPICLGKVTPKRYSTLITFNLYLQKDTLNPIIFIFNNWRITSLSRFGSSTRGSNVANCATAKTQTVFELGLPRLV